MRECAFCPHTAKLSAEHIVSTWINDLFPGKKKFTRKDEHGNVISEWVSDEIDWTAKVVCQACNNTWMSRIESLHAKPVMTDLIRGVLDISFSQSAARSVAIFAFKT